jgi:hypothetical protein
MLSGSARPSVSVAVVLMALVALPAAVLGASGPAGDAAARTEARTLLARLITSGDYAQARMVAAERGIDGQLVSSTSPEAVLYGSLVGDFRFLPSFHAGAAPKGSSDRQEDDALASALMLRRQEASALVARATALGPEDRRFVEILLASATRPTGAAVRFERTAAVEAAAESFLEAFPASPYRRFLMSTLVAHYRPGNWAFHWAVSLALSGLRSGDQDPLGATPLCYGRLGFSYHGATVGFLAVSQGLCEGDELTAVSVGYRASFGRHRLMVDLGVGPVQSTQAGDPGRQAPPVTVGFTSGLMALEYQRAFAARDNPRSRAAMLLTVGLVAVKPISVPVERAALHLMLQVGLGLELAGQARIVD